jgi:hypothetical protein
MKALIQLNFTQNSLYLGGHGGKLSHMGNSPMWEIVPAALLVSDWLEAFSCRFFLSRKQGKHLEERAELAQVGLPFFGGLFPNVSTPL